VQEVNTRDGIRTGFTVMGLLKNLLAGLNALQGEFLQDEPCPMVDKPLLPIGREFIPPQSIAFSTSPEGF